MGNENLTFTTSPLCIPGFHLGIEDTTRNDSLSSFSLPELFIILMSLMLPSFFTTNSTNAFPCIFSFAHSSGYLRFSRRYFINAVIPPENSGICSTTLKICSSLVLTIVACATDTASCFAGFCSLNPTGITKDTFTASPLCIPGFQLGIEDTTRIASLSRFSFPELFTISTLLMQPSFFTINLTIARPSMPFSRHSMGYLTLSVRYLNILSIPPGKWVQFLQLDKRLCRFLQKFH